MAVCGVAMIGLGLSGCCCNPFVSPKNPPAPSLDGGPHAAAIRPANATEDRSAPEP